MPNLVLHPWIILPTVLKHLKSAIEYFYLKSNSCETTWWKEDMETEFVYPCTQSLRFCRNSLW